MIKIIKNGKTRWWEMECNKCGCVFQMDDTDFMNFSCICCPQCGHFLSKHEAKDVGEREIES